MICPKCNYSSVFEDSLGKHCLLCGWEDSAPRKAERAVSTAWPPQLGKQRKAISLPKSIDPLDKAMNR